MTGHDVVDMETNRVLLVINHLIGNAGIMRVEHASNGKVIKFSHSDTTHCMNKTGNDMTLKKRLHLPLKHAEVKIKHVD